MQHKINFWAVLDRFEFRVSFSETSSHTKDKEPSLPYYSPIAGGRINEFLHLPKVFAVCEMQTASSMIWTHVAVFISYITNNCFVFYI